MIYLVLLNPVSGETGGIDMVAVIIGSGATFASVAAAWLAFRGKKINPLENGIAFVSAEAQALAEFHREDAARARESEEAMRVSVEAMRLRLNAALDQIDATRHGHTSQDTTNETSE